MGSKVARHNLREIITLLFALKDVHSMRDANDLRDETMNALLDCVQNLDPALFAQMQDGRLAEREDTFRAVHQQLQARRYQQRT